MNMLEIKGDMLDLSGKRLVLGSGSPRRKELLSELGLDFTVDTGNNFIEDSHLSCPHSKLPELMSLGKSHGFHRELSDNEILITSDTLVLCHSASDSNDWDGGEVFGKPKDREDAYRMLKRLSGDCHRVITSVTLRDKNKERTFSDVAEVYFDQMSDEEIYYYIDKFKPFDKAGAYGIQEWIGYAFISGIKGSYHTVMGLPVHLVYKELKNFIKQ